MVCPVVANLLTLLRHRIIQEASVGAIRRFKFLMCAMAFSALPVQAAEDKPQPVIIEVSVSFNLPTSAASDKPDDVAAALERGRKQAYEVAARECAALLATIASTCKLDRINVTSQAGSGRGEAPQISANVSYRVQPK